MLNQTFGAFPVAWSKESPPDPYGIHHRLSGFHVDDDEFSSGNTFANYSTVTPTGSVNWVISNHVLSCVYSGQSTNDLAAFLKPVALSDGEWLETCLKVFTKAANYTMAGIVVTDGISVSSNALALMYYFSTTQLVIELWKGTLTNMTTNGSSYTGSIGFQSKVRLRLIRVSSTSYTWSLGLESGAQFSALGTTGTNPGFTPSYAGLHVSVWGAAHTAIAEFDYLRRMS